MAQASGKRETRERGAEYLEALAAAIAQDLAERIEQQRPDIQQS